MKPTITIIFSPDGSSKVETNGFTGKSCIDASKFLESEFGVSAVRIKPEFYHADTTQRIEQRQS